VTVIAFGDSHALSAGGVPGVVVAHAGAVTLNRLGRDGQPTALLTEATDGHVGSDDAVLVFAGEIDVRGQVWKQVHEHGRSSPRVIEGLVDSAVRCALELRSLGLVVAFCAVIPPSEAPIHHPEWAHIQATYPFHGSLPERVVWDRMLNAGLTEAMPYIGVKVFDPYGPFTAPDGSLDRAACADVVHLSWNLGRQAFAPIVAELEGRT
jgi:hypothetical protein